MITYDNEKYLSTLEAATYVGKDPSAFRQYINRNKEFPRRKLGGRLFFPLSELYGYFARQKGLTHLEENVSYDSVYPLSEVRELLNGCSLQNVYDFVKRNKILKYCDNFGVVFYSKSHVNAVLDRSLKKKLAKENKRHDVSDI